MIYQITINKLLHISPMKKKLFFLIFYSPELILYPIYSTRFLCEMHFCAASISLRNILVKSADLPDYENDIWIRKMIFGFRLVPLIKLTFDDFCYHSVSDVDIFHCYILDVRKMPFVNNGCQSDVDSCNLPNTCDLLINNYLQKSGTGF